MKLEIYKNILFEVTGYFFVVTVLVVLTNCGAALSTPQAAKKNNNPRRENTPGVTTNKDLTRNMKHVKIKIK